METTMDTPPKMNALDNRISKTVTVPIFLKLFFFDFFAFGTHERY